MELKTEKREDKKIEVRQEKTHTHTQAEVVKFRNTGSGKAEMKGQGIVCVSFVTIFSQSLG